MVRMGMLDDLVSSRSFAWMPSQKKKKKAYNGVNNSTQKETTSLRSHAGVD